MRHRWPGLVALGLLSVASTAFAGEKPAHAPDGLLDARAFAGRIDLRWSAPLSRGPGADLQTGRQFARNRGRLAG